ncbi:MAG: acyltransferase family protein, partial [Burkholderiaceae bacterium]|nr:acyltransferase family protein [Burkholderiaceae bacterium]
ERRARRIFPALFAVLAVTLAAGYFLLLPSDYAATLRGALGTLFFASNIVFWRDMAEGYFAATDVGLNPLLHTWSLAVEEQFYVFFPVLLLLCYRYFRRHIVLILIGCAVGSLAGAALLVQSKSVAVFFLSPFRAWELLVGALLAFNAIPAIKSRPVREIIAGAGLLAILVACFVYDAKTTFPGLAALAPVLGAAAIMHAGVSGPSLVGRLLQLRPVVYVGLISYSLYLWHWPLIVLTRYAMGMEPITSYIPALLAVSLALGSLSYHFIEQPFRRGVRVTRKFVFSSSAVFTLVLGLVSAVGLVRGGYAERFTPAVADLDEARLPEIPFKNCNARAVGAYCMLGRPDGKPTMLFWGDSHLLSWAPALNEILSRQGVRAAFVTSSACPPILGVTTSFRATCAVQNLGVKDYLQANPDIKTVVMAAFWTSYFRKDVEITAIAGNPPEKGLQATSNALISTIQWLRLNKQVILIGPVPVYDKSVPLALALELATGRNFHRSSLDMQQQKNAFFFKVVEDEKRREGDASFRFLDPIKWLCADECMVMKDGVSLYRDAHHLSVAGAKALEAKLFHGFITRTLIPKDNDF